MKFKLELDIDWIEEDSTLDETIKQEIIASITNKVYNKVSEKIKDKVNTDIDKKVLDKVDEMTENLFNTFLDREVVITDNYGSSIKTYKDVTELIKEKFDNFMTDSVDESGNATNSSYGKKYGRINYIVDKQLKEYADQFTTEAVEKVSTEIRSHVKEGLTKKLGNELMNVLKVDKMLQLEN